MSTVVSRMLSPLLARLGSRTILTIGGTLFVLNMLIPDPIPFLDELLILAVTILLSRWAQPDAGGGASDPTGGSAKPVGRGSTQR